MIWKGVFTYCNVGPLKLHFLSGSWQKALHEYGMNLWFLVCSKWHTDHIGRILAPSTAAILELAYNKYPADSSTSNAQTPARDLTGSLLAMIDDLSRQTTSLGRWLSSIRTSTEVANLLRGNRARCIPARRLRTNMFTFSSLQLKTS